MVTQTPIRTSGQQSVNSRSTGADEIPMSPRRVAPLGFAALATGLLVAIFIVPGQRTPIAIAAVAGALAVIAVLVGVIRGRAAPPTPWIVLAVGMTCWTASLLVTGDQMRTGGRSAPGAPEAIAALGAAWMVVGVVGITAPARRSRDLFAGSDSVIVALAASASIWLVVVDPVVVDLTPPFPVAAWFLGFVSIDLALAVVAFRSAIARTTAAATYAIIGAAFVVAAAAHLWSWLVLIDEPSGFHRSLLAVSLVAPLLLGVAALRSSDGPGDGVVPVDSLHWGRVIGLTVSAVVPVTVLAVLVATGHDPASGTSIVVVAVSSVIIVSLVIARVGAMVVEVRRLAEQRGQVRLAAMVEYSNDVVMIVDATGTVTYASPGVAAALGHRPGDWIGRRLVDAVDEDARHLAVAHFGALIESGRDHTVEFETMLVGRDGQRRHGNVVMVNRIGDHAVDGVVVTFRDITEQRDLERQLSHRAFHDELTGLANRALFLDRMDHALRINRPEAEPVMVLFIDLDDFKDVNDVHGHGVGDETLRVIAARIREAAATGDTAARLGGDEFAVLLEDSGGIDRAIELSERLLAALREPVVVGATEVVVLASIGIAVAPAGASTTSLLRDADIAMYEAKRAGKGQVRIFDPAMRRVASRHLAYRSELSSAIERGQLRVVYLPYVDLRTGEVRGAEALVRWQHPEHGEIAPSEFIPIAERTGLIVPIGHWVIGEALDQIASWRSDLDLFVSVNLSAAELRQHDLLEHLRDAVRSRGLAPSRLMLEVTETDLMEGGERSLRAVAELREHGFGLALDDFGAGYCSISHLQRHPVDMLKIDRTYVGELGRDATDTTLARAILRLADTLGIVSAAEGVETPEQLHELRRSGCRLGQGYLLSGALEAPVVARRFGHSAGAVPAPQP